MAVGRAAAIPGVANATPAATHRNAMRTARLSFDDMLPRVAAALSNRALFLL